MKLSEKFKIRLKIFPKITFHSGKNFLRYRSQKKVKRQIKY